MGRWEDRQRLPADHFRLRIYIPLLPYWMAQPADAAATPFIERSNIAARTETTSTYCRSLLVKNMQECFLPVEFDPLKLSGFVHTHKITEMTKS